MPQFGVSAWDINTNAKITDVPVSGLKYNVRLNDWGEVTCGLDLVKGGSQAGLILGLRDNPFKLCVTTNDDTLILYSGIVWVQGREASRTTMTLGGKALMSYFQNLVIPKSYTVPVYPGQLIANVLADAQAVGPGANRGIGTQIVGLTSPPMVDPDYHANQYVTVGQVIADMTAAATPGTGGVDIVMQDTFVNGKPNHTLAIMSPRCGRDQNSSGLSVNLERALDWNWPSDSGSMGNQIIVVGKSSTGGAAKVAVGNSKAPRGGGGQAPLMQQVLQYSQVGSQTILNNIAAGQAEQLGQPVTTPTIKILANYAPCALGAFSIGDDINVWSGKTAQWPDGMSEWWRIAAYSVSIPDEGVAVVELTLNRPPIF